ncbi:MAG: hypothetical protein SVT56_11245 [Chloroflexota bacterium]|nr:hypothetical protein [Chloroflexota bacterium]
MNISSNEGSTDYLTEKILHARRIKEAVALEALFREGDFVLSSIHKDPPHWDVDKPLCQYCWEELSEYGDYCPLCQAVASRLEASRIKANTGILIACQNAKALMPECHFIEETTLVCISGTELLVLLPTYQVAGFLTALRESRPPTEALTNIVFPGNGELTFGDAIALARYSAGSIQDQPFLTKFYFNHSHMRAFDFDTFLSFDITTRLFETAAIIKSAFSSDDRAVIKELLKYLSLKRRGLTNHENFYLLSP